MSANRSVVRRVAIAWLVLLVLAPAANASVHMLKRGSRGPAVARLQQRLRIPADGVFGAQTQRAVRRYQRSRHLAADGIVGPRTAAALRIGLAHANRAPRHHHGRLSIPSELAKIARCESGGNPRAVSSGGTYRGKYQFDNATWRAIGGHGDPARASEREQDQRALLLLRTRGTSPWPSCA
jgi:soluble lytic murein transglycosylase-like protein